MAFIRKITRKDSTYLVKVESYRENGKVKQRVLEYIGKEENGVPVQKVDIGKIDVVNVKQYADVSILLQVAKQLNLHEILGQHYKSILSLVVGHLLCKASVKKISSWIEKSSIKEELNLEELSTDMLYRALDYLEKLDFDFIEEEIFEVWKNLCPVDTNTYVLDVTDTYYNGKHDNTSLRKGKDGSVSKLIQIGLAVSFNNGFPILHKTYKGNISNIKILEDLLQTIAVRGLKSMVLDRGFYSEANIIAMQNLKMEMIVGMKQSIGIKNTILSQIDKEAIYTKKNLVVLKETVVYAIEQKYLSGKMIIIYNPKFEVMKKDKMLLDDATDTEVKYVGYSLIFHNTKLKIEEVVKKYFDKDIVERSFRTMKGDAMLHPVRLWVPERINAHVKLCYLSMCILSLMKYRCEKLNLSTLEILTQLQSIYKVNLLHVETRAKYQKVVTQSTIQTKIVKALKCSV